MPDLLSALTIGVLVTELAKVERAIRDCDPLFIPVGDHLAVNPDLIELASDEQEIRSELTRRLIGRRGEPESRVLATQSINDSDGA